MKAYGLTVQDYENDSKKVGDYGNADSGTAVYSAIGARNALRIYKKRARRTGKAVTREALRDITERPTVLGDLASVDCGL